jgi:hypothetical protein
VNLLNPIKQDASFCRSFLKSMTIDSMALGYENSFTIIGSKDSLLPNSVLENFIRNVGGSRNEYYSVSNFGGCKIYSAVSNSKGSFLLATLKCVLDSVDTLSN